MKVEDYKFIVNDKEVSTIEEWFEEFKKLSRTEFAFEESKKDVYKKIEKGVLGHTWTNKKGEIVLRIKRKEGEVEEDEM